MSMRCVPDLTVDMISKALGSDSPNDWRLLRKVPLSRASQPIPARASKDIGDEIPVVFLTLDASGPYIDQYDAIRIQVVKCTMSPTTGKIATVLTRQTYLQEPVCDLHRIALEKTGLRKEDLDGHRFPAGEVMALFDDDPLVMTVNAYHARPFFEKAFPDLSDLVWVSLKHDGGLLENGFLGTCLDHLLLRVGFFVERNEESSAPDASGLAWLANLVSGISGNMFASRSIEEIRIQVFGAPYEQRHALTEREYTWIGDRMHANPHWVKLVAAGDAEDEKEFLSTIFFDGDVNSNFQKIDATRRYCLDKR